MTPSLDDYRWLTSSAAHPWLARVTEDLAAGVSLTRLTARLRRDLSCVQAHLVLAQVELRKRAREKFSQADKMFFTPLGLAQATDEALATYKAARFAEDERIADLCCGIGGDLMALGDGRACVGIDRDFVAVHLASVNAAVCGHSSATAVCRDVTVEAINGCSAWHIDPDRRPEGKRTVQAERFEPPWETVETLLARCQDAAVKVAPATSLPADVIGRCQREWIESRGECRQQVAWFGKLARDEGSCQATVIDAAGGPATIIGVYDQPAPVADSIGPFLYEPNAAVRAARLVGALCRRSGLAAFAGGRSYLTGENRIRNPLAAGFEVLESLPFDLRRLASALNRLDIEPVEIKKRGVEIDPGELRRKLNRHRGQQGVVLIAPVAGRTMAIVAKRFVWPP
ncbi:MAG TPA: hypothetical protein VMP01_04020 [Pirellulaceae bacterium]|nr:hypothetical protein [Pirellulaceae bacterium]